MDERIITETLGKIKNQYTQINELYKSVIKDNSDLSININDKSSKYEPINDDRSDTKLRILMRIKHIERYVMFMQNYMTSITNLINDIPPYNISLEIVDSSAYDSITDSAKLERLTEEIYNTINIDSDDDVSLDTPSFFDTLDDYDTNTQPNDDNDDPSGNHSGNMSSYDSEHKGDWEDDDENEDGENEDDHIHSDVEELEVSEIEIDNVKYYTTDQFCGKIYHILANDEIGNKVGVFDQGIATFY
jgi:hypothetical protein